MPDTCSLLADLKHNNFISAMNAYCIPINVSNVKTYLFKVDRLQIIVAAKKYIYGCNCSSVGYLSV